MQTLIQQKNISTQVCGPKSNSRWILTCEYNLSVSGGGSFHILSDY